MLIGSACLLVLLVGLFFGVRAAENGYAGTRIQTWVRIEKSRFIFNRIYSSPNLPFEAKPSALVVRAAEKLPKGAALDIAAGQGRNSLYLARLGWRVTAIDISDKGLEIAQAHARAAGVQLATVRSSAQDFSYGRDRWDAVLLVYAPIPYDDARLLESIRASIKPGGLIIIETPVMMHRPSGETPRVPGDLERNELPRFFPGFDVVEYTEADDTAEWFNARLRIARFAARKR